MKQMNFDEVDGIRTHLEQLQEELDQEAAERDYDSMQEIPKSKYTSEYAKSILASNKKLDEAKAANDRELRKATLGRAEASVKTLLAKEGEKMEDQNNKGHLAFLTALAKIQEKGLGTDFDKANVHFGNSYFSIDKTTEILQSGLKDSGLVYRFRNTTKGGESFLELIVSHVETGYTERSVRKYYNFEKMEPQKHNGAETYYKRQMLLSFFSIKGELDDDGNSISPKNIEASKKPSRRNNNDSW